jgi:hypothetical protein
LSAAVDGLTTSPRPLSPRPALLASPRDGAVAALGLSGPVRAAPAGVALPGPRAALALTGSRAALALPGLIGRVTLASRSAAAASCSSVGRDTSRARIALDSVILIPATPPVSPGFRRRRRSAREDPY